MSHLIDAHPFLCQLAFLVATACGLAVWVWCEWRALQRERRAAEFSRHVWHVGCEQARAEARDAIARRS